MASVGRKAYEYRSEQVWGDLPVVHISVGGRQADGRYRLGRARGIIALGDIATGLVAIGGVAIGLFSAGGVAIGLVALGAVAIGLVAVGAVSIGLLAVGAVVLGLAAMGAVTVGLVVAGPRSPVGMAAAGALWAEDGRPAGGLCSATSSQEPGHHPCVEIGRNGGGFEDRLHAQARAHGHGHDRELDAGQG